MGRLRIKDNNTNSASPSKTQEMSRADVASVNSVLARYEVKMSSDKKSVPLLPQIKIIKVSWKMDLHPLSLTMKLTLCVYCALEY